MLNHLREELLIALESEGNSLISNIIKAIQSVLDCDMCTLWSINYNNTNEDLGEFKSASLLIRYTKNDIVYPTHDKNDYVHPLAGSFIDFVLDKTSSINYYYCNIEDDECKKHKSYLSLINMKLKYLLCIPIVSNKKPIAFIKIAFKNEPNFHNEIYNFVSVINQVVVSALSRLLVYQKQQILDDLIKNYRSIGNPNLKEIFNPIINRILRKYFYYEGSSVFIWDYFDNRYNLLESTGLNNVSEKKDIYYEKGEGLTGVAAKENKAKIYDDLKDLENSKDPKYLHKYRENTKHHGETLLAIPIVRPSNPKDVFGIIRFTNKINKQSKEDGYPVLDYFNDTDVELIENASHYLALNIENYLAEEERRDFISKMSHEFKTPANAIRVTAERIQRKVLENNDYFMKYYLKSYLQDIIDCSELQLMQVTTNLFLTKSNRNKKTQLRTGNYSISKIIKDSIKIVRPIARDYNLTFDNIKIDNNFPNVTLRVNKDAFKIVFYNLLTNTIKYVDPHSEFRVKFEAIDTSNGLIIYISDFGIGIDDKDVDRIFLLGVRSKRARRINVEGYGIGLHVVKSILNMFAGDIQVKRLSNPTTFEIKLPRNLYV